VKRFFIAAIAGFLVLATMAQGSAQYGDERAPRLALRIGIHRPSGDRLKSELGSNWKLLGLQYSLSSDELERPTAYAAVQISSDEGTDSEASLMSIQYERVWWARKSEGGSAYYGAGAGLYFLNQKDRPFAWMEWTERSGTKLGFTGLAGYEIKQGYFAEIRYSKIGKLAEGLDFSGLSLSIGARLSF